jgi:hypothetical protein
MTLRYPFLAVVVLLGVAGCRPESALAPSSHDSPALTVKSTASVFEYDPTRPLHFSTPLTGGEDGTDSRARGVANFEIGPFGGYLRYKLIVANIENVRQAHVHIGAPGTTGPIVLWLYPQSPPAVLIPGPTNGVLAEGTQYPHDLTGPRSGDSDFVDFILAVIDGPGLYVNVHTDQYPGGEIRGQIGLPGMHQ